MNPIHPSLTLSSAPLEDLKRAFPNPIDLRAALRNSSNGDLYRKICIRELTALGQIREAYSFAREVSSLAEREAEFNALIPALVDKDEKEALEDLPLLCSEANKEVFLSLISLLYLEFGNLARHVESLLKVTDVCFSTFLIYSSHQKISPPYNSHLIGSIIETYLLNGNAPYALHLIKFVCPKLNPNASVEDLLFAAGTFLLLNDKFNDLQLIINELTSRKMELLGIIITHLLNQGDTYTAIGLAKNLPDSDSLLMIIANALLSRQNPLHVALVIDSMGSRRNEFIDLLIIPLLDSGNQEMVMNIVHALERDKEILLSGVNQYLRNKIGRY
ncbi:MAG: hypothetical protein ACK4HV_04640 [Parachlamydiaceae bacterium]